MQASQSQGAGAGEHIASAITALGVAAVWQAHADRKKARHLEAVPQTSSLTDDPQYPGDWDDYVGQEDAKAMLKAAVRRARDRSEPVRHVLIACPEPGIGKTALAVLLAREIGTRCFTISGTPSDAQVQKTILSMNRGDVLFIDEIHRLVNGGKARSEWLLHVLQDDTLMGPMGAIKSDLGITVVGATTDVGLLPEPLIERFGVQPVLSRYSADEAFLLAVEAARTLFGPEAMPSDLDLIRVIHAADFNPRRIKQLLQQSLDSHYDEEGYSLDRVLTRARMTDDGLNHTAQRLLVLLLRAGKPVGATMMRNLLQESSLTYVERRLTDKGFLTFTSSGRTLTDAGSIRARELVAEGVSV